MTDKEIERASLALDSFSHASNLYIHDFNSSVNKILRNRKIFPKPYPYIYSPFNMRPEFHRATIWQGLNIPRNVFNPTIFTSPRKGLFILVPLKGHPTASLVIPVSFKF